MSEREFIEIYRENVRPLYRFVSKRAGGARELSEDIVQETFLRAVRSWRRQGFPRTPLAWLHRVARNLLASHYRRVKPRQLAESTLTQQWEDSFSPETPEEAEAVQWGLARLRPEQTWLLEAFHFDRRPVRQLAAEMGISDRAVEGRLRRARQALRRELSEWGLVSGEKNDSKA